MVICGVFLIDNTQIRNISLYMENEYGNASPFFLESMFIYFKIKILQIKVITYKVSNVGSTIINKLTHVCSISR